jgi:hypothetical protein
MRFNWTLIDYRGVATGFTTTRMAQWRRQSLPRRDIMVKVLMKLVFCQSLALSSALRAQVSWRKCHKKAKNVRARLVSNLTFLPERV